MDVHAKLDEIVALTEGARAMPMSASILLNRGELLGHLEELRELLPSEVNEARSLLRDRDDVLADARRQADKIIADAKDERARLVAKTEVMQEAARESEHVRAEATAEAARMRAEVEDYVDGKLANFEVVLHKTLAAVERGRSKLSGRQELDKLRRTEDEPELPG